MDHDVKRVVAAGVASIHVLLQQNYARRAATNYPGCALNVAVKSRGIEVARSCDCTISVASSSAEVASNGSRKRSLVIRTFRQPSFYYRHLAFVDLSAHVRFAPKRRPSTGNAHVSPDADQPLIPRAFGRPGKMSGMAEGEELASNLLHVAQRTLAGVVSGKGTGQGRPRAPSPLAGACTIRSG